MPLPPDPYTQTQPAALPTPPDPYAKAAAPADPYARPKHYGFDELRSLWQQAGGDPQYSDIMAHVALAESGDGKSSANPQATGTPYQDGGHTYRAHGLWQISDVHGNQDWNDPLTNAKKAVELFNAQRFGPWEASRSAGAGGGWGQYLGKTSINQPLPAGGFGAVVGATPTPTPRQTQEQHNAFVDTMEGVARSIASLSAPPYGSTQEERDSLVGRFNASPQGKALGQRLSGALKTIGEAADAFTFAPLNAFARAANEGNAKPLGDYWHDLTSGGVPAYPGATVDRNGKPLTDFGKRLDTVASQLGFNSPNDILYWASQPGFHTRLAKAKPKTAAGKMLQLALGMHSDLARLKPAAPYLTGLETFGGEMVNPAYLATGKLGSLVSRSAVDTLAAARAGAHGAEAQRLAQLAAETPLAGNRFTRMGDAFGIEGEHWHASLARDLQNAPYIAQDFATSSDTFGGATLDQQVDIVHQLEGTPIQNPNQVIGDLSIADRAANVGSIIQRTENELRAIDPEMAKRLLSTPYFPHGGAWELSSSEATDPRFPQGIPSAGARGGAGAASSVMQQGRLHETLGAGQAAGLMIDPDWAASGAMAQQQSKMLRYIALAKSIKHLETMKTAAGTPANMEIEYLYPLQNQALRSLGKGAVGYERAMTLASQVGKTRSMQEAVTRGTQQGWTQDQINSWASQHADHYRDIAVDEMRKVFRSRYPTYDFDAADSLGMPMLKGRALENSATAAAIDSHPQLSRIARGDTQERFGIHTQSEQPDNVFTTWLDNLNSVVRQGILSNVGFHPGANLIPLALNAGVNPRWIARAVMLDRAGTAIPKTLIDRAHQYNATAPKFGTGLSLDPNVRAKLLTVPYNGLSPTEMMQKAFVSASKWNQDVTFGYFEDRLAAVVMRHFEDKGMGPEAAARETRKLYGDYENMTVGERAAGMRNWHYFYTWMRSQLRYWGGQAVTNPRSIMAPIRGVQTANQQQGDAGSVAGGALSLRSALNGLHYGWGTDAHGNPRYVSLPFPQFRYGSDVAQAIGGAASGDPDTVAGVGTKLATTSLPPVAGLAMGILATELSDPKIPEPYNAVLWDKNAPSPAAKWGQFFEKYGEQYEPSIVRGPQEAIGQHDPILAAGALGPNIYSSPNSGPQTKAIAGLTNDLRGVLKIAENQGDHTLANQIYDLMLRVNDGDPLALIQARRSLAAYRREEGARTNRFKPRI
jgi:hypothetical protein